MEELKRDTWPLNTAKVDAARASAELAREEPPSTAKIGNPLRGNGGQTYTASSYDELIPELERRRDEYRPMSAEALQKLRRRQRAEGIISGISDAVRSVANLVAAHNYAPNMYDPRGSMSAKAQERFDRLKAEREADADKYFNYAMTIGRLKNEKEQQAYQRGRDALQDKIRESQDNRAQLKADRDAAMADLRMQLMQGRISEQDAAAEAKRIEADYAERYWDARVDKERSQADKNRRQGTASWVSGRGSGSGSYGGKPYGTLNGVTYQTAADYNKAVAELANEYGVPTTEETETVSGSGLSKKTTQRTVRRRTPDVARDVEAKARERGNAAQKQPKKKPKSIKFNEVE